MLFLGLVEYRDPEDNKQIERLKPEVERFKGWLFRIEDLPEGFELTGSILGVFLKYKGFICSRGLFCYDGEGWFNWSHNKPQTPEEFVREHNKAEKFFTGQDPQHEPEFIDFQGHTPGLGGSNARELGEGSGGSGADVKNHCHRDEGDRSAHSELKSPDRDKKNEEMNEHGKERSVWIG